MIEHDVESYIRVALAKRGVGRSHPHRDDLEQVGRIAAWVAIKKDPKAQRQFVYQRVVWKIDHELLRYQRHHSRESYPGEDTLAAYQGADPFWELELISRIESGEFEQPQPTLLEIEE